MNDAPFDLTLLPASARVDDDGSLSIGGVDLAGLAAEFGTPLYVYDEDELRARCRGYRDAFGDGCRLREQGVPLRRDGPARRRGRSRPRRRHRRRAARRVARRLPGGADRVPRQQQVERRAATRARRGRRSHRRSTRSTSSIGSKRSSDRAGEPRRGARPRDARRRGAHARVHRDRHRGLEVRLRPRQRRRACARCGGSSRDERLRFAGLHCHIGSQVFRLDSFAAAIEKMVGLVLTIENETGATVDELNLGGGLGVRYVASDEAAVDRAVRGRRARGVREGAGRRRGAVPPGADDSSPGARSPRRPGSRCTRSARSRRSRGSAPTSRSTAG